MKGVVSSVVELHLSNDNHKSGGDRREKAFKRVLGNINW